MSHCYWTPFTAQCNFPICEHCALSCFFVLFCHPLLAASHSRDIMWTTQQTGGGCQERCCTVLMCVRMCVVLHVCLLFVSVICRVKQSVHKLYVHVSVCVSPCWCVCTGVSLSVNYCVSVWLPMTVRAGVTVSYRLQSKMCDCLLLIWALF